MDHLLMCLRKPFRIDVVKERKSEGQNTVTLMY